MVGVCDPYLETCILSLEKGNKFANADAEIILVLLKQNILYQARTKNIPHNIPKWSKSIPFVRPKPLKNHTGFGAGHTRICECLPRGGSDSPSLEAQLRSHHASRSPITVGTGCSHASLTKLCDQPKQEYVLTDSCLICQTCD